jgi:hypothetical protein
MWFKRPQVRLLHSSPDSRTFEDQENGTKPGENCQLLRWHQFHPPERLAQAKLLDGNVSLFFFESYGFIHVRIIIK